MAAAETFRSVVSPAECDHLDHMNVSRYFAAVSDGVFEAWTGFECGYARARGKYLLGIATRDGLGKGSSFEAMCGDMVIFDPAEVAREVNARLLEADEVAA